METGELVVMLCYFLCICCAFGQPWLGCERVETPVYPSCSSKWWRKLAYCGEV